MTNIGCCSLVFKGHKILALECAKGRGLVLPGGKWEENETYRQCAARELYEETGLTSISSKLIFHAFNVDRFYCYCFLTQVKNFEDLKEKQEGKPCFVSWEQLINGNAFSSYYDLLYETVMESQFCFNFIPIRPAPM